MKRVLPAPCSSSLVGMFADWLWFSLCIGGPLFSTLVGRGLVWQPRVCHTLTTLGYTWLSVSHTATSAPCFKFATRKLGVSP